MLFFQKRSHVLQPKGTYRFHEFTSALHVHKAWGPEVLTGIRLPVLSLQLWTVRILVRNTYFQSISDFPTVKLLVHGYFISISILKIKISLHRKVKCLELG